MKFTGTPSKHSWACDDTSAPSTPWGRADQAYDIRVGVRWFGTSTHGGLYVSASVAETLLTAACRSCADLYAGAYWFEEDCMCRVPFFEHPEWERALSELSGATFSSAMTHEAAIREWIPRYFERIDAGYTTPVRPKVGDTLRFTRVTHYGRGYTFGPDDIVTVDKVTKASIIFRGGPSGINLFRLSMNAYMDGVAVRVDAVREAA